jgi:TPR repeat protein
MTHNSQDAALIRQAKSLLEADKFEDARRILDPLIARGNAEAQYLGAGFSWGDETEEKFDRRYLNLLRLSAEQDFPPALYALGYHYDTGDLVGEDKVHAARLFMRAAAAKHAHSQWLHGLALLYGRHGVAMNQELGLLYIQESADAMLQGALETLARFHETGEFGFPVDLEQAQLLKRNATSRNAITY